MLRVCVERVSYLRGPERISAKIPVCVESVHEFEAKMSGEDEWRKCVGVY